MPRGPYDAHAAVEVLGEIEHTAKNLENGIGPDLYSCLQKLDTASEILCKLDRAAVSTVPVKLRGDAFRAFHAALWTWLARHNKLLEGLLDARLVAFGIEKYGEAIPQIAPIASDVPSFNTGFLGVLQDLLKEQFLAIGFIPERFIDADVAPPGRKPVKYGLTDAEKARESLPLEDYYAVTQAAVEEYFRAIRDDPAAAKVLAKEYTKYVFTWLGSLQLLQDIASRLVNGDPYIRKRLLPDGGFEYVVEEMKPR
jgi:hypothetical protein